MTLSIVYALYDAIEAAAADLAGKRKAGVTQKFDGFISAFQQFESTVNQAYKEEVSTFVQAYKQNQTKNANTENCECSSKKTTDQMSNKKYFVQGAVDSGTRMAQLKFNTFNTANKTTKHKFRGDYKERNENEQHHVIDSRRKYNWGTNFCCPKPTSRPPPTSDHMSPTNDSR